MTHALQSDGSVVVADLVETDQTTVTGTPVVRQVTAEVIPPEVAAIDLLPGVQEQLDAIEDEAQQAQAKAKAVRDAFLDGHGSVAQVENAERDARRAQLTTQQRKNAVRAEAKAAWADRLAGLIVEHRQSLDGRLGDIEEAKAAAVEAVANLLRVANDYNARFGAARRDLTSTGPVPLPEGMEAGSRIIFEPGGTHYGSVAISSHNGRTGLVAEVIGEATARAREGA